MKISFNKNWKYSRLNENIFTFIDLPHDAMIYENRSLNAKGGINISYFEGHDYIYVKSFDMDKSWEDSDVIIEFEGIYQESDIYLNDELIHHEDYGYNGFYIDVTKCLRRHNELKVIAKNSNQPNSRWYTGSGIYRDVNLYVLPKERIELNSLKIKADYLGNLDIRGKLTSSGKVTFSLLDENNIIFNEIRDVGDTFKEQFNVDNIIPWSAQTPKLYTLKVSFKGYEETIKIGFRSINLDLEKGLLINDKREILLGACIHHDNGLLGACENRLAAYRKIKLLKEVGYNAIRSAHNPISKTLLEACDELGMYVLDEYVDCWFMHKTKYDYASHVETNYSRDIALMCEKDYNHPSVIMYSTGNEVGESASKRGIEFTKTLTDAFHKQDETRPVTCGINIFFNLLSSMGLGVYSNKKAEKDSKSQATKKKASVGSEFFNNLAGLLGAGFMKWGASTAPSDWKTKGTFANMDVAGYNYGINRYRHDLKKYKNRYILGSETFCSDARKFYDIAIKNPRLIGDFVWAGMDYIGEVGVGSWTVDEYCNNDFSHQVGWLTAGSGRIDITGKLTCEALFTQVMFDKKDIAMGVIPVHHYKSKTSPSAWKFSRAIDSWTFHGYEGKETEVEVYSKAHVIELYLNNKLLKKKRVDSSGNTKFLVKYYPGELKAISYDKNKNKVGESILKTGDSKTCLSVVKEESIIESEFVYIRFTLGDQKGNVHSYLKETLEIKDVENAVLVGFGNGCSYSKLGYKTNKALTYYGEALAIFKKTNNEPLSFNVSSENFNIDYKE